MKRFLLFVLVLSGCEPEWMDRCRRGGGTVQSYNCRETNYVYSCGTEDVPMFCVGSYETCNYRCVGARSEGTP